MSERNVRDGGSAERYEATADVKDKAVKAKLDAKAARTDKR